MKAIQWIVGIVGIIFIIVLAITNMSLAQARNNASATAEANHEAMWSILKTGESRAATQDAEKWQQTKIAATAIAKEPTLAPTETPQPTETLPTTPLPTATEVAAVEEIEVTTRHGWDFEIFSGATQQMNDWVEELQELAPELWSTFPNVDNPAANFLASDGLEYGMAESSFCQQEEVCDIVVPAMHYRLITGDYDVAGYSCSAGETNTQGCALMLVNVGDVSASFEDAHVDSGWTVFGRYWNGDAMSTAVWAGLSHVSGNMLNLNSALNQGGVNAGANCSVPTGCEQVQARFIVISGNEILLVGTTTVERDQ